MGRNEGVMERNRQNRVVAEVHSVVDRKPIDPDAGLVERLRRRDEAAPAALVASHGDRVYRLAIRLTGNRSDAEEVAQDALWSATRKIDTFRGAAAFGSWLYRITANAAYQKLRGRRGERHEMTREDLLPSFDASDQHIEAGADWPARWEDPALQAELRTVLRTAIDDLPDNYRAAFELFDLEGLSKTEIAEVLQLKLGTVKSRVHRARRSLRRRLAGYMSEPPYAARHVRIRSTWRV